MAFVYLSQRLKSRLVGSEMCSRGFPLSGSRRSSQGPASRRDDVFFPSVRVRAAASDWLCITRRFAWRVFPGCSSRPAAGFGGSNVPAVCLRCPGFLAGGGGGRLRCGGNRLHKYENSARRSLRIFLDVAGVQVLLLDQYLSQQSSS